MKLARGLNLIVLFLIAVGLNAQSDMQSTQKENLNVQKYTVMEKFESDFMLSVEERKQLKLERREIAAHRKSVLDTLNISDRRRQRLLRELNENPFSDKINRTFAEIEFEDDDPETVNQNK